MTDFYCILKDGNILNRNRKNSNSRLYDDRASAERDLFWSITHNLQVIERKDTSDFYISNIEQYKRYSIGKLTLQSEDDTIEDTKNTSSYNECINGIILKILDRNNRKASINDFWYHLIKLGVAKDVMYIAKVVPKVDYSHGSSRQKNIRDSIRLLGLKSNRYRMRGDYIAFMNKKEATSARLCINCETFINIDEIRNKAISMI